MLTELEPISKPRATFGHRSGGTIPCGLPDAQALLELSLREIETAVNESLGKLPAVTSHLCSESGPSPEPLERARYALRGICSDYANHLRVVQERIAERHHPHGRCGASVGKLQTELVLQIDSVLLDQQQLSELAAEQSLELAARRMTVVAAKVRTAIERLKALVQGLRKTDRQPQSIILGGAQRFPHERDQVRDQLARSLRRWWETCTVQPGPMTIAVIDLHRLHSDCPQLSREAVAGLLQAGASLIVSDRRTARVGIAIDTNVISVEGDERYLAWSCAVIEDQRGHVQSIIAAGLDKTSSQPAKMRASRIISGGAAADLAPSPPLVGSERRRKQRNPFPYVQLIAPYSGCGLPPTSAFFEALCHDISEDGFSFLSAAMPASTSLVVALGTRPPHLYMTARIAHFTRCETVSGAKYIVGCQFTGRAMVMAQFA